MLNALDASKSYSTRLRLYCKKILKRILMKMPEQTHSGQLNRTKVAAQPEEGTRSAGKSNDPEASLRKSSLPQSSEVKTVDRDANAGLAKKLAGDNDNGNPKHRTKNCWGTETVKGTGKES